jgi:NRAMP (natural resistance-associated macrophage protein)-like metal ion transporter
MNNSTTSHRKWFQRLGPGLIIACVVIGPGSITTSTQVGATHGFALTWVVVLAVVFMMTFMQLGARLGAVSSRSPAELLTKGFGRPLAVLIGLGTFFISASFQFGNNLGVDAAVKELSRDVLSPETRESVLPWLDYSVVAFNGLAIAFLLAFKNLYRALERLMMCFVGLMLVSFALNLGFALANQVPAPEVAADAAAAPLLDFSLLGLVGTTFVITAAFYQAYLVQQKGWTRDDLQDGMRDARVGSVLMALITLMIMCTAAAVLRGQSLKTFEQVSSQLAPLFGAWGRPLFCIGLFAAAYSSFLVNSMIGGFILADGLGLGSRPDQPATRALTVTVLLIGMGVALFVIKAGFSPVPAVVAAQAVTVLAAPLTAWALIWLTNNRQIMGEDTNSVLTNVFAWGGFVLLLAMALYTAIAKVIPGVSKLLSDTA